MAPHIPKPRFTLSTLLILTVIVALTTGVFLTARQARKVERRQKQYETLAGLVKVAIADVKSRIADMELRIDNVERRVVEQQPAETATNLRLVTWNVESDGNNPATIARQLTELDRYDVYALQEVKSESFGRYASALRNGTGKDYRYVGSTTGRSDRLMIIFDSTRLELMEVSELFRFGHYALNDWRHRSPLVAHFRDKQNGAEFYCVTVHLARGDADLRTEQATGLREWAKEQRLPVVAIGDFNMDYDFPTQKGNAAFDAMLADDTWTWVKPDEWIDTSWSDFCFVRGVGGSVTSRVIVRDGDFPDDEKSADHRPVELLLGG